MRMVYQFTISNFTLIFFFSVTSELYNTLNKIALHFAAGVNCRHLLCVLCCVFLWQFRFRFQFQFRFNSRSRFPFNLYCVVCICILKWPNCHCPYAQLRIKNPESRIENIEYRVYNNLNCVIFSLTKTVVCGGKNMFMFAFVDLFVLSVSLLIVCLLFWVWHRPRWIKHGTIKPQHSTAATTKFWKWSTFVGRRLHTKKRTTKTGRTLAGPHCLQCHGKTWKNNSIFGFWGLSAFWSMDSCQMVRRVGNYNASLDP